jgi:hypothetical protein
LSREVVDGKQINIKRKYRYQQYEFDKLQMYFGKPYVIDLESAQGSITVEIPTVGDIMEIGEKKFYGTLGIFITNTTSYRLMLDELKLDWNTLSDFELFCMLYSQIDDEVAKLMFGELDFKKFTLYKKELPNTDPIIVLWNQEENIEINEEVYQHIAQYLRAAFNMYPEEKITSDPILKDMYLHKDRRALEIAAKTKKKDENTSILPLISACVNHPGFKYKPMELRHVNICEFYDSVKRLQVYENTTALLKGSYSGMIDSSKIDKEQFNFMRDV